MHKKHVMHRDIKPANILLNKNGVVKLADFGVSGILEHTQDGLSSWVGTMTYMSPERLKGQTYFADTDLWSLGIVLVECATGTRPYTQKSNTGFWELINYMEANPSPRLPDEFSVEFRDFVSICLHKQGGQRSTSTQLLQHPFIDKFKELGKKDLKKWINITL